MKAVYPNLLRKMNEQGITVKDLAVRCGITEEVCLDKLNGVLPWTFTEVVVLCRLFGEPNAELLLDTVR